jgi:hypothetical protein
VVSFNPGGLSDHEQDDDAHLNVRLTLHGRLYHPDLSEVIAEDHLKRTALRQQVEFVVFFMYTL